MVRLAKAFQSIEPIRALVVGDFMLDTYTTGTVDRISPEAPVPVLKVKDYSVKPGGAGNVVLNLLALGADVYAMGRVGDDEEGRELISSLKNKKAKVDGLFKEKQFKTPVKHRLIAESQQVIRVDREETTSISFELEQKMLVALRKIIKKVDVIAISDYAKGFLSTNLLQKIIQAGKEANLPIIVDPKGIDFSKYNGASVIKPNFKEAMKASKEEGISSIDDAAAIILNDIEIDHLIITRSNNGISLFQKDQNTKHFPVRSQKEVKDVTGAGDTVLAMLTMACGNRIDIEDGIQLSNLAASIAVEHIGCAHISFSDLARRLLELDFQNKVYHESHLFAIKEALRNKSFSIVALDSGEGISTSLFDHLSNLAKDPDQDLVCYVKDPNPNNAYLSLLSSMKEVDFIVLQKESLESLCHQLKPSAVFEMKGEELIKWNTAVELLQSLLSHTYVVSD